MSLDQLNSQIGEIRDAAASIQKRWARTRDSITNDNTLTDIGKQQKLDAEREQVSARLSDLRAQERELIADKKQSLEKSLFGLGAAASTYTDKIMSYRDAQDRARRLELATEGAELLASALRSDDEILAAAVLGKALASEWRDVIAEYLKYKPRAAESLNDLMALHAHNPMESLFAYMTA